MKYHCRGGGREKWGVGGEERPKEEEKISRKKGDIL